jgi:hypothetical protein
MFEYKSNNTNFTQYNQVLIILFIWSKFALECACFLFLEMEVVYIYQNFKGRELFFDIEPDIPLTMNAYINRDVLQPIWDGHWAPLPDPMQLRHVLAYYTYAAIHNLVIYEFSTKLKLGFSEKGTHLREIILNGRDRKLERLAVCASYPLQRHPIHTNLSVLPRRRRKHHQYSALPSLQVEVASIGFGWQVFYPSFSDATPIHEYPYKQ